MESHKTSTNNSGFTLIETIVVIGLFLTVCFLSPITTMKTMLSHSSEDDIHTLVSTLKTARMRALTNTCVGTCTDGVPHGVYFEDDQYTLFQGNSYDSTDPENEMTELSPHTHIYGASTVVFLPRSGRATSTPSDIWDIDIVPTHGATTTININSEGRISVE